MWRIVYTRSDDGGVSVVYPAPEWRLKDESEADWQARVMARSVPKDAINARIVDEGELPFYDSATRDAWRDDGQKIAIDPVYIAEPPVDRIAALEGRLTLLEATAVLKDN